MNLGLKVIDHSDRLSVAQLRVGRAGASVSRGISIQNDVSFYPVMKQPLSS